MRPDSNKSSFDHAEAEFFSRLKASFLRRRMRPLSKPRFICGVDASYDAFNKQVNAVAVIFHGFRMKEVAKYHGTFTFPYVSGLFYLHEGPFVFAAVNNLATRPDIVCFDAHGAAHPNARGMATICGAVLGIPSIGLAKSALVGAPIYYRDGLYEIVHRKRPVGFLEIGTGYRRYWSFGYSVSLYQLRYIIKNYGEICVRTLQESHRIAGNDSAMNIIA